MRGFIGVIRACWAVARLRWRSYWRDEDTLIISTKWGRLPDERYGFVSPKISVFTKHVYYGDSAVIVYARRRLPQDLGASAGKRLLETVSLGEDTQCA